MTLATAMSPSGPLAAMAEYAQFILWTVRDGRKLPVNPYTAHVCNAHDPAAWVSAAEALSMAETYGPEYGVGFVFTANDPFFFLDIDKAALPDRTWSDTARTLWAQFPGAAVEVSQSGKGLHIFGRTGPLNHSNKNGALGIELYTRDRFVALTGKSMQGDSGTDHTGVLSAVAAQYFPPRESAPRSEWRDTPVDAWDGITDDDELIAAAKKSRSRNTAFGGKATFGQLWKRDPIALGKSWPDGEQGREYDASNADASLAQHLAFWTGNHSERILRLMKKSGLYRDKYEREDYLPRTISGATARQKEFYNSRPEPIPVPDPTPEPESPVLREGLQYFGPDQVLQYFEGCVYIRDLNRIFVPDGGLLKREVFCNEYDGYIFALDTVDRKTTTDAWKAFTGSQAWRFPKVHSTCFRPDRPAGEIIFEKGRSFVNVYVPINAPVIEGDTAPFIGLLEKLLPAAGDREILLSWMAALIQYPGIKFEWAPLIQGCEGNGKSTLSRVLEYAIGSRYVHRPKASDLDARFNYWLLNKRLIVIEDIKVFEHRQSIIETLKPWITNGEGLEIHGKGIDQFSADVCANFILNSNHQDAIPKTRTDRRYCILYTAQQFAGDRAISGMEGAYFPELYAWLNGGGYAHIARFLQTYDIPEHLNPATLCRHAPVTSTTGEAYTMSLGPVEQEVLEAIAVNRPGFVGGWVSSTALDGLLKEIKANHKIYRTKRRGLMQAIGYDRHPGLVKSSGRVTSPLQDGTRPILYIKMDHPDRALYPAEIPRAYETAQTKASIPGSTEAVVTPTVGGARA